jgi:hypothetical protein
MCVCFCLVGEGKGEEGNEGNEERKKYLYVGSQEGGVRGGGFGG